MLAEWRLARPSMNAQEWVNRQAATEELRGPERDYVQGRHNERKGKLRFAWWERQLCYGLGLRPCFNKKQIRRVYSLLELHIKYTRPDLNPYATSDNLKV